MAAIITPDSDSDFGYDFSVEEEELLLQLGEPSSLHHPQRRAAPTTVAVDGVPGKTESVHRSADDASETSYDLCPPRREDYVPTPPLPGTVLGHQQPRTLPSPLPDVDEVRYPNLSAALSKLDEQKPGQGHRDELATEENQRDETLSAGDPGSDERSPLQRFRSFPRKPLTVSDLTSGAWCELQYWYTLTKLPGGRRTRTPAMKQGSTLHKKLEDQVHTTVKIEIMTKEDGFGLRLWNLVQGLRTLRDNGLTRELEVWGMIDGNLVNGVIDSVSYENPNPEFEEELSSQSQEAQSNPRQSVLTDFYPPKSSGTPDDTSPKVYLTDVKTRGSRGPISASITRPAKIQLLLYHRMLSDMAACDLDFFKVFRRYGLDADDTFSDAFLAQIAELHDEVFVDASASSEETSLSPQSRGHDMNNASAPSSQQPDFLKFRTLRELIVLVEEEISKTFPHGASSLGCMLRVEYVHRDDGQTLDVHDFPVSKVALNEYLDKYMAWWRGERNAFGVTLDEAYKCRTCEFASDCSWRQQLDQARVHQAQEKVRATRSKRGHATPPVW